MYIADESQYKCAKNKRVDKKGQTHVHNTRIHTHITFINTYFDKQ